MYQGSANFFCKGPDGRYFWLCEPHSLCCKTTQPYCQSSEAALDNTSMNERGLVPTTTLVVNSEI